MRPQYAEISVHDLRSGRMVPTPGRRLREAMAKHDGEFARALAHCPLGHEAHHRRELPLARQHRSQMSKPETQDALLDFFARVRLGAQGLIQAYAHISGIAPERDGADLREQGANEDFLNAAVATPGGNLACLHRRVKRLRHSGMDACAHAPVASASIRATDSAAARTASKPSIRIARLTVATAWWPRLK